jgi:hypothetical protein
MKNYIIILFLILFSIPQELFSQDQQKGVFEVSVNYLNVKSRYRNTVDPGIGIGVEYRFPLVKKIGLDGLGSLGYQRLLNCDICYSEWYQNGYSFGIGLSKTFELSDDFKFIAQLRYRRVGTERYETTILIDNIPVKWEPIGRSELDQVFGLRLGYFLPIDAPIIVSYTYEKASFHWLNSVSVAYQF